MRCRRQILTAMVVRPIGLETIITRTNDVIPESDAPLVHSLARSKSV